MVYLRVKLIFANEKSLTAARTCMLVMSTTYGQRNN